MSDRLDLPKKYGIVGEQRPLFSLLNICIPNVFQQLLKNSVIKKIEIFYSLVSVFYKLIS